MVVIAGLFLALGLFMLTGKGEMLVAGYNASKRMQEKYDGKKLSRLCGVMLIVVALAIGLLALEFAVFETDCLVWAVVAAVIIGVIVTSVIGMTAKTFRRQN